VTDLIEVTALVVAALERTGVPYTIGGSLASSFSGEPRASIDADILVDMTAAQVASFLDALGDQFYVDADALRRAIENKSSTNLIHFESSIKVDLFVAGSLLDARQLERRRRVEVGPNHRWFIHSPEDILLQKLLWYRQGGEVSDRQWRDAIAILIVQDARLDRAYLRATASLIGVSDLLERGLLQAGFSSE
jgi:hypothetical protein